MKKIIILLILAVSVVFMFSGCDAILETMFPDETGQGGGKNFITVGIDIDKNTEGWESSEVWVELQGLNDTQYYATRHDFAWDDGNQNDPAHIDLRFDFLPDGEYQANVWLDKNSNGQADNDEPFAQVQTDYGTMFPMPYPDPQDPNNPDKQYSEMNFPVHLGAAMVTTVIGITGPKTIKLSDISSPNTYTVKVAKAGYGVSSFDWRVNDPDSSPANGTGFTTNFSSFGEGIAMLVLDNIKASDGQTEITIPHYEEPVRIVVEPDNGAYYKISVNSWGFDMPPWGLDYGAAYNVRVEILDNFHILQWGYNYMGVLVNGGFSISSDGTGMGPNGDGSFNYSPSPNVYFIRVFIDTDNTNTGGSTGDLGYRDSGDLVYESEIGLSRNLDYDDGSYYWRDFNFDPFRFMKAVDFNVIN